MRRNFGLVLYRVGQMAALALIVLAFFVPTMPAFNVDTGFAIFVDAILVVGALLALFFGAALRFIFSG